MSTRAESTMYMFVASLAVVAMSPRARLTPARWAIGARQQSVIWPMSGVKNRSRCRQARPLSPSPSRKRAVAVMRRNSSLTEPDSTTNLRTCSLGSTAQYEP